MSTFYNDKGHLIYVDDIHSTYIGHGDFGTVRRLENGLCMKIQDANTFKETPIVLSRLKNLNFPNLYKIREVLYKNFILSTGNYYGYLMDYYKPCRIDILTMPVDYTIENLLGLYRLMIEIGKLGIELCDIYSGNIIVTDNNIVIIDCDNSTINSVNINDSIKSNLNIPLSLIHELYNGSLSMFHEKINGFDKEDIDFLFGNYYEPEDLRIERIVKILSKYEYPIDALRSISKR